ncbi:MAG TPA: hypothetical protein VM940_10515, partial [Chthoniobacterales bacterium]|nr:hypothetical protein [Chthoniobacterales bacterium]
MTVRGWYQRMNPRERILASIVAGAIFLLLNFYVWGKLLGMLDQARSDLAARRDTRKVQEIYIRERALWEKRAQWLTEHQPALKGPGDASTLLDQIKQIAGKHNVLIENPAIGTSEATRDRQAVFANIEVKSPWPPLVKFLYDLQQPESFIVFE